MEVLLSRSSQGSGLYGFRIEGGNDNYDVWKQEVCILEVFLLETWLQPHCTEALPRT